MNITEKIQDELVLHDLDLIRYERGALESAMVRLTNLQTEVVALIKEIDPTAPIQLSAKRKRLDNLLIKLNRRIDRVYRRVMEVQTAELAELAILESKFSRRQVNNVTRVPLLRKVLGEKAALQLIETTLIPNDLTGATIREKWLRSAANLKENIKAAMRGAVDNGRNLVETLRIVRGNRALRFKDGIMFKSRSGAETLLRTAGAQITNASRLATYRANTDTVAGFQSSAILDSRTTLICHSRNGWAWRVDGKAFPGTPERFPGSPPWHFNCRTTIIPIFKTLEDLQSVLEPRLHSIIQETGDDFSFNGEPAPGLTFNQWLQRKGERQQKEVLGKGKWELWNAGKISTTDLVNTHGNPLTLSQLKTKVGIED